ncbi:MAG: hypothetical protein ABFS86_09020 [Planctomycetota bacterium]
MNNKAIKTLALLMLLLPLAAAEAKSGGKAKKRDPGMRFVEDLDEAIAEAKDRNIPLWVAYHQDN